MRRAGGWQPLQTHRFAAGDSSPSSADFLSLILRAIRRFIPAKE